MPRPPIPTVIPTVICPCCGEQFTPSSWNSYRRIRNGERPGLKPGHKYKLEQNGNWKGGAYALPYAGRFRYLPGHPLAESNGYVLEHRLVVAPQLQPGNVVHHKDRNNLNNSPDNLQPMTRAQHAHLHYVEAGGKPLTRADYDAIRALKGALSQNKIARQFGITQMRVSRIFRDVGIYIAE